MTLRKLAILLLAPLALSLTACDGDTAKEPAKGNAETISYRGEGLSCFTDGGGKTRVMGCDFQKFYRDNPDLLQDKHEASEEAITWYTAEGHPLACVTKGAGTTKAIACDYERLYATYPSALDK